MKEFFQQLNNFFSEALHYKQNLRRSSINFRADKRFG